MDKKTQSRQRFTQAPVPLNSMSDNKSNWGKMINNKPLLHKGAVAGFTLIEILVVIGMIAILATIVIIAINPARQFAQGRNSQRVSNVNTILNAIGQRIADNKGVFAGSFDNGSGTSTCPSLATSTSLDIESGTGGADLSCLTPTYIPSGLPFDPSAVGADWNSAASYDTKYQVSLDSNGRYTISAPSAELGQSVSVTR